MGCRKRSLAVSDWLLSASPDWDQFQMSSLLSRWNWARPRHRVGLWGKDGSMRQPRWFVSLGLNLTFCPRDLNILLDSLGTLFQEVLYLCVVKSSRSWVLTHLRLELLLLRQGCHEDSGLDWSVRCSSLLERGFYRSLLRQVCIQLTIYRFDWCNRDWTASLQELYSI